MGVKAPDSWASNSRLLLPASGLARVHGPHKAWAEWKVMQADGGLGSGLQRLGVTCQHREP